MIPVHAVPGIYPPGEQGFPAYDIPAAASKVRVALTRAGWKETNDPALVTVTVDFSGDGGASWIESWMKFTATGGQLSYKGLPYNESGIMRQLPDEAGATRKIRIHLSLKETIMTSVKVEVDRV